MESIVVHLKNKPSESIRIESLPASEALKRLEVGGLDRVVAVKIDGLPL